MRDWRELTDEERAALEALRLDSDASAFRVADTQDMEVREFLRRLREIHDETPSVRIGDWSVSRATYSWPGHKVRVTTFRTDPEVWVGDEAWELFASAANLLELPDEADLEHGEDDEAGDVSKNIVTVYVEELQKPEMN